MLWQHAARKHAPLRLLLLAAQEVLINVAPKKANWDLRRDIAGSLARLERRTQVSDQTLPICCTTAALAPTLPSSVCVGACLFHALSL